MVIDSVQGFFMPSELVRERSLYIDKGFEYYKHLNIARDSILSQDSIITAKDEQLSLKDQQITGYRIINKNTEQQSRNYHLLARDWKSKARKRSFKIVVVGGAAFMVGYLVGK